MTHAKIISLEDFLEQKDFFVQEALKDKIFVYPTDTIYGIGALASCKNKVMINEIKQRDPYKWLSVIAPSTKWIEGNYSFAGYEDIVKADNLQKYLDTYHGVTFIFDPIKYGGVRIIKHPMQEFVAHLGEPFITTSVNTTGEPNCSSIDKISDKILPHVDYIIDAGPLNGKPSVLVNLVSGEIVER